MTTKVIFSIDEKLKGAAMRKAKAQGLTLTAVLNMATRAFVDNKMDIIARDIAIAREQIRQGKAIPAEEVWKRLGI